MCEVLECCIFRKSLLRAEAVEMLCLTGCEAVSLQRCIGGGLFLELGERIAARRALGAAEERHFDELVCMLCGLCSVLREEEETFAICGEVHDHQLKTARTPRQRCRVRRHQYQHQIHMFIIKHTGNGRQ